MVSLEKDNHPIVQDINTLQQIITDNQDQNFDQELNVQPENNKKNKSKINVTRIPLVDNIQTISVAESTTIPHIQASKSVFIPDIGAQTSKAASKSLIPIPKSKFTAVPKQSSTHPMFQSSKQSGKTAKRIRDESPTPAERNKTNGLKLLTPENLPINRESHFIICDYTNLIEQDDPVEPKNIEELFDDFEVKQPNAAEQAKQYESYRKKKLLEHSNMQPTREDIEKARAEGYVLGADWKTQFTVKAFKRCRRIKNVVKQVAVEYSNGDVQWIN